MEPTSPLNMLPTHPVWGQALGLRRNGEPIWPTKGASEPAGDTSAQGGDGGDGTAGQSAGTASGDDASTSDGQSADTTEADDKVNRTDYDAIKQRMQAADKRAAELEAKLKGIEDKDKSELERATERAKTLEQEVNALKSENQQLKLERTMLSDPEWGADKWQDPEEVLDKLNRAVRDEQVTVTDGQPDKDSVKKFLKDLATKKQYLLKPSAGNGAGGKSGAPVGGGDRRGKDGAMTDDEVRSKYRIR
jgi:hypothetical protein